MILLSNRVLLLFRKVYVICLCSVWFVAHYLLALYVQFAQNSYICTDQIFDCGEHLLYVQIGNVYDTDASFMTQLKDELQSFAEVGNTFKVTSG